MNKFTKVLIAAVAVGGSVLAFSTESQALTATSVVDVTANVNATCTLTTATAIAFGSYDPASGAALDGTGLLNVNCTNGAIGVLGMSNGGNFGAGALAGRAMGGFGPTAGSFLNYRLSSAGPGLAEWGTAAGIDTVYLIGTGAVQNVAIFGRIPGGQAAAQGGYFDQPSAILTY